MEDMPEGALTGIRVLEAGLLVQGPQAAALLAQFGAAVTKVELPGLGDQARWLPMSMTDFRSAFYLGCNRGKRSVTVDVRRPAGQEVFRRLAATADVVITNFKPGTMEAWGLGYEDLCVDNPGLVYASRLGVRPEGPRRPPRGRRPVGPGGRRADQRHRSRRWRADDRSASRSPTTSPP